ATGLLVAGIAWLVSRDGVAAGGAGAAYVLLPSTFESYYTLSKCEPLLVFWLASSVWLLLRSVEKEGVRRRLMFGSSCVCLAMAYLTKETALAMVITTMLWAIVEAAPGRHSTEAWTGATMRRYFAVNVVFCVSFFLAKRLSGVAATATGDDSSHYMISIQAILDSALRYLGWCVRDYPHVLVALGFLGVLRVLEHATGRVYRLYAIGVCWMVGAVAIM